jgi:hypothetical protein
VRAGLRVEIITVTWMAIEAIVSIGAGIVAGSILLTAFGIDSVIELVSYDNAGSGRRSPIDPRA